MCAELRKFRGMRKMHRISGVLVENKRVLVRGDLDVEDRVNPRTEAIRNVVRHLQNRNAARIKVIGPRETNYQICDDLRKEFGGVEFDDGLRSNKGETANDYKFAEELAKGWDIYVNEAFATSHRKHASIVALPEVMKRQGKMVCLGMRFEKEIEQLDLVWGKNGRRFLVIGGTKVADKEKFAEEMKDKFAEVLKGGLLSGVNLRPDGLDIADKTIEEYKMKIKSADVILAAGVMGKYEDAGSWKGTREVLSAIAESKAYKVAGGGDIEMAIDMFGLTDKFDWISVGGGAMLVYLSTQSLPGLEALA